MSSTSGTYLFAVQDADGHEILSWKGYVEKVSSVTTRIVDDEVHLLYGEEVIKTGELRAGADREGLHLHRWEANDKLGPYVSHRVSSGS